VSELQCDLTEKDTVTRFKIGTPGVTSCNESEKESNADWVSLAGQ
jgi:hypothetical protein